MESLAQAKLTADNVHEPVTTGPDGRVINTPPSLGMEVAMRLNLARPVVFQEHSVEDYQRPLDIEVEAYKKGNLKLGEMTPAYAYAMVWADLKTARGSVHTFKQEIELANLWKEKLTELQDAFGLPEGYMSIDTSGPIYHVHPVEKPGESRGSNGSPLHFDLHDVGDKFSVKVGRGFEAILPTHVQNTGYNTPAHPEMEANVSAKDAIPSIKIGSNVRIGGAFNAQGSEKWVFEDNCWLGQGCYFISQEHPAELPSQLARVRQSTNFPGMHVGSWSWVAKQAQILYRTQYIGEASVVAAHAKVNNWVGDCSLVTSEGHQAFYPAKSFVLNTLGIRDLRGVLSLDWEKVEDAWRSEYNRWRAQDHSPDANIAEVISTVRDNPRSRVLFLGTINPANIIHAATPGNGKNQFRRIDIMSTDQMEQAYVMQALNGIHNLSTRFRKVEKLSDIPLGKFYEEPAYDAVVMEVSAQACCNGGDELHRIYEEARRLVKRGGVLVGRVHGVNEFATQMTMPEFIGLEDMARHEGDSLAIHAQSVINNGRH